MQKRVAVILCGSGYKDGSEIRESVGLLWALAHEDAEVHMFALDETQSSVVNCLTGDSMPESRNQLIESARIARGQIKPLSTLKPEDFDLLMLPGGYGAAKNLCNFATHGKDATAHPLVESTIRAFHQNQKPIGAICIAPMVVALSLRDLRLHMTLGPDSEASRTLEAIGHVHMETKVTECYVDRWSKVVTTPAYMDETANLVDIFKGIRSMVKECFALLKT